MTFSSREPHKLSLVWSRRSRRVASAPMAWEPTLQNPYKALVVWPVPENHQVAITLFKDPRTTELEDKDWSFIIEDVSRFFYLFMRCYQKETYGIFANDELNL